MEQKYIQIMIQNLNNKVNILERMAEVNIRQKNLLEKSKFELNEYDAIFEEKSELLRQIQVLSSEFETLYVKIKDNLQVYKTQYVDDIEDIQRLICKTMEQTKILQELEANNKACFTQKMAQIKDIAKSMRTSARVVGQYQQNMQNFSFIDPQFLDNKN